VLACVDDIRAAGDPRTLAVCHGGSIRVVLCASDPRGLAAFHAFRVPNVSVVSV
jgi:broad specificity phosphatase PhoE